MTQSIGSLVAELSANTASFQKDLGKAASLLNSHATQMNRMLGGIEKGFAKMGGALTAALSVGALATYGKRLIDTGDDFSKLSQKTGVSVEKLSEFAYGADLSGASMEELSTALRKLATNMSDAAANSTGQMAQIFRDLGIAVTDANGNLRETDKVFEELASKFNQAADGPEKTAIAVKLLGKSGDSLIPLLNDLDKLSAEARKSGAIVSTEFAKSAEAFNDNLSRMGHGLASFARDAIKPAIDLVNAFFDSVDRGDRIRLQSLVEEAERLKKSMEETTDIGTLYSDSQFNQDMDNLRDVEAQIEKLRAKLKPEPDAKTTNVPTLTLPVIKDVGQVKQFEALLQQLHKAAQDAQAAINQDEQTAAYQRMAATRDEFIFKAKQLNLWVEEGKQATKEQMKVQEAFNEWLKAAEKKAAFESRTPFEKMTDEWGKTTKQMQNATAGWANDFTNTLTQMAVTGKGSFKDLANSIISDLIRIGIQKAVSGITSSFSLSGIIGGIGSVFGFADGGNPPMGQASLVGERGPELIVPRTPSTVIPNHALGGSTYIIDARGADSAGLARLESMIRDLDGSIERRSVSAWVRDRSRGGVTASFA